MKPSDYLKPRYAVYKGKDAQTTREVAIELCVSDTTARRHLKALVRQGIFKEVLVKRPDMRKPEVGYVKLNNEQSKGRGK